ncbi:MAG: tyrosine-type recombinase/integrase, partial [Cyclobacteriaceae bacterium]
MATYNFYLDKPDRAETYVLLYIREKGKTIKVTTGLKIPPQHWNKEKQKAKQSKSFPAHTEFNRVLKERMTDAETLLLEMKGRKGKKFRLFELKEELEMMYSGYDRQKGFFAVYDEFLDHAAVNKGQSTFRTYKTLRNHLTQFSKDTRTKVDFERINVAFLDKLNAYYHNKLKFLDSSRHKYLTILVTFMNWATDRKYNENLEFKRFKKPRVVEKDIVHLTKDELFYLYQLDLSQNSRLERVRDIFCLGCFTGLRFSDISKLQPENIKENHILVTTYKTKDQVRVPLSPQARQIIDKYKDHLHFLPTITNQKANSYLKELGEYAGINELVTDIQYRGSQRENTTRPKYEMLSTHTGRRTFVTLALEAGHRPEVVMAVTGHKSYKTFKKYIA